MPDPEMHGITFRADTGMVRRDRLSVLLTPTQLTLFECFLDAYPKAVSNAEAFAVVYDGVPDDELPSGNIMAVHISNLRRKIRSLHLGFETHWGFGHSLVLNPIPPSPVVGRRSK